ncbi:GNAT family N-acetyltransferase [Nocardioides perillae]|uniref:GNAT superfamily N-acetyltransferase n=1 Tax=Nocardioides perillae TaxID=1119534 RepID=A0A7Y9RPE7_9ACTN|nr:GNAT family N-acetyltransferase [Nocardioides perillae]NYG54127.1 GNAT superfamily N-acetyltransferase [Nocardioides perillae]
MTPTTAAGPAATTPRPLTGLPAGLTSRPLTLADAEAVHAAIAAEEVADLGEAEMTLEDVLSDWQRPSYDITASTVGVLDGDLLVAYADHSGGDVVYTAVLPAYQGRGIGTALAAWLQATARAAGATRIGTQVPEGSAADRFMRDHGYALRWTAWDLELPPGRELEARPLPEGYALRDAAPADHEAAWTLLEDCFLEWSDRARVSLDDFGARVWGRPGAEPWNLRLLHAPDGTLVGATHVHLAGDAAYVAKVAVRPDHRGRGLAPAMLVDAFGLARAHGAERCYLSTDTRAGARGLYERVGMEVASTWVNRALTL